MILVTGASGFIGKHVCLALAANNHKIVAVDRDMAGDLTCECVQGDLTQSDFLLQLFQAYSFDRIVHLASLLNTMSREWPLEAMRVNVGSSLGLLKLAVEHPGTRFIYGSSISVYGSKCYQRYGEVSVTIFEKSPILQVFLNSNEQLPEDDPCIQLQLCDL